MLTCTSASGSLASPPHDMKLCKVVRRRERRVRGPGVHDSLHSDALGLGQAEGDPHGHDCQPAGKEVEDAILH